MTQFLLSQMRADQNGRALVRVPINQMQALHLQPGDTVAICVERTSHARVVPAPRGGDAIEATEDLRKNVGGAWGHPASLAAASLPVLRAVIIKLVGAETPAVDDLSATLFDMPLAEGDRHDVALPMGRRAQIEVVTVEPGPAGLFRASTGLSIFEPPPTSAQYDGIGGMSEQIARVHEMVAVPLLRPDLFERLGVPAPRGVLFTGSSGSGKTLLARAIAAKVSAAFYQVNGPEIVSKHYGESEAALRKVFQAAQKNAPSIIFIDEIDAIAPRREGLSGEKQVERRIIAQLLTLMDGLTDRGQIILMAATNLPDSLDPALRRPGRFDREINFGPPNAEQRREILEIHLRSAPLERDVDLHTIAQQSHGYVGADLASLARESAMAALERTVFEAGGEHKVDLEDLVITQADLNNGFALTAPSALREDLVESPIVTFDHVGGLEDVKSTLSEAVIWPHKFKESFEQLNIKPNVGILLSGPPGSGKTLLARALAAESGMNFIPVRPTRILSQFLGDAERAIANVFAKARHSSPCLVFFDELDALAPRRSGKDAVVDRIVAQMLTEIDGMAQNTGVVVLAATNRAAAIDPALTRPGRFDDIIAIPLPDKTAREAILTVHCRKMPLDQTVDLEALAKETVGVSGAWLAALVSGAARSALRRSVMTEVTPPLISAFDFQQAQAQLSAAAHVRQSDFIAPEVIE